MSESDREVGDIVGGGGDDLPIERPALRDEDTGALACGAE